MSYDLLKRFAAELFELKITVSPEQIENAIELQVGEHSWKVDVGGNVTTWLLSYSDSSELPISNTDYYRFVKYKNKYYRVKRVFSDAIWVTKEAEELLNKK